MSRFLSFCFKNISSITLHNIFDMPNLSSHCFGTRANNMVQMRLSHFVFDAFFDTLRFTFDTSHLDFDTSPLDFDAFNFKAF